MKAKVIELFPSRPVVRVVVPVRSNAMVLRKFVVSVPGESDDEPPIVHDTVALNAAHALSNVRSIWQRTMQAMKLPKRFNRARVTAC